MTGWLEDVGVVRSTISTFAWLGFAYSFKFLWSPLVDSMSIPGLTRLFGRRRAWLLLAQIGLAVSILAISRFDPTQEIGAFVMVAVAIAFLSATQDIVIDAYRIESADQELQGVLAASYQYGYRLAVMLATAGALYIAQFASWSASYQTMAAFMLIGIVTTFWCHEPAVRPSPVSSLEGGLPRRAMQWMSYAAVTPLAEFFSRHRSWGFVILGFVCSFWISDRVLGILAYPFYINIGFSLAEIASIAKVYGTVVALVGAAAGAAALLHFGMRTAIIIAPILLTSTNLLFAALTVTGPDLAMLTVLISFDNFAQAFGSTVMIAYMSSLINLQFTATQYALISSIGTFVGKFAAGYSGDVQLAIGWYNFFLYAAATGIPSVLLAIAVAFRLRGKDDELRPGGSST